MSWLARSIAKTLELGDDKAPDSSGGKIVEEEQLKRQQDAPDSPNSPGRGVKEDLSDLTKTLTRQFWGVASFLAPPPSQPLSPKPTDSDPHEPSDSAGITGIRSDFAEIGGKFRTGISKLSNNLAVSEFTKMASNFLQLAEGEEDGADSTSPRDLVGVTDGVVTFIRDVAMHPETWLDFPLPNHEDDEDFDLSDAQQEHALAVERLVPQLSALRFELCPRYMSEGCFWKIYFVLLHPRLDMHAAELLTTDEIAKARASLIQELPNHTEVKHELSSGSTSYSQHNTSYEGQLSVPSAAQSESLQVSALGPASTAVAGIEKEKHPVLSTEIPIVDKSVVQEGSTNQAIHQNLGSTSTDVLKVKEGDDGDDWFNEESSDLIGIRETTIPVENEEDISFSDLEEDDGDVPTSDKKVIYSSDSSTKDSRDWVQLSRISVDSTKDINNVTVEHGGSEQIRWHNSEARESNDWLDVEDVDVA